MHFQTTNIFEQFPVQKDSYDPLGELPRFIEVVPAENERDYTLQQLLLDAAQVVLIKSRAARR